MREAYLPATPVTDYRAFNKTDPYGFISTWGQYKVPAFSPVWRRRFRHMLANRHSRIIRTASS